MVRLACSILTTLILLAAALPGTAAAQYLGQARTALRTTRSLGMGGTGNGVDPVDDFAVFKNPASIGGCRTNHFHFNFGFNLGEKGYRQLRVEPAVLLHTPNASALAAFQYQASTLDAFENEEFHDVSGLIGVGYRMQDLGRTGFTLLFGLQLNVGTTIALRSDLARALYYETHGRVPAHSETGDPSVAFSFGLLGSYEDILSFGFRLGTREFHTGFDENAFFKTNLPWSIGFGVSTRAFEYWLLAADYDQEFAEPYGPEARMDYAPWLRSDDYDAGGGTQTFSVGAERYFPMEGEKSAALRLGALAQAANVSAGGITAGVRLQLDQQLGFAMSYALLWGEGSFPTNFSGSVGIVRSF